MTGDAVHPLNQDKTAMRRDHAHSLLLPFLILALLALPREAAAHCDALDGPVVNDARAALAAADVTPVLKWVAEEDEAEVRAAYRQTLIVRAAGPEAEALADRYFFETVVRLHRTFEGAPYTGLQPAGLDPGPAVRAADAALASASLDDLKEMILREVAHGLEERFDAMMHARSHADHNPEAGRHFVHAYVEFVHFAKRLHEHARSHAAHAPAHAH